MISTLCDRYLAVHRQGFVPIFINDGRDALTLAEICVAAGSRVVEITCRRPDAAGDIRRVAREFPALVILAGSVVDEGRILSHLQRRSLDFPSLDELADAGAHGFVSAMPLSLKTVAKWSPSHLLAPGCETVWEAANLIEAGATFAKLFTTSLFGGAQRVAQVSAAPLHGSLPLFVTGGVTRASIPAFLGAGAAVLGSGWDLIAPESKEDIRTETGRNHFREQLSGFLEEARVASGPNRPSQELDDAAYLRALNHYHPFAQ
jgi:2-dehydro-3-deoxyphosphogluconate aldolase / (4S)-4-hydroxy-2-oxoglutarate aldolase